MRSALVVILVVLPSCGEPSGQSKLDCEKSVTTGTTRFASEFPVSASLLEVPSGISARVVSGDLDGFSFDGGTITGTATATGSFTVRVEFSSANSTCNTTQVDYGFEVVAPECDNDKACGLRGFGYPACQSDASCSQAFCVPRVGTQGLCVPDTSACGSGTAVDTFTTYNSFTFGSCANAAAQAECIAYLCAQ